MTTTAETTVHPHPNPLPQGRGNVARIGRWKRTRRIKDRFVIFTQVFIPDPASVGQHIADVAFEMARRGYTVRVYTANRGYDDPTKKYPKREAINGVEVFRLPLSSFGKRSILTRIVGTASFMIQAVTRGIFMQNLAGILFSTSPPLIGIVATTVRMFRGVPLAYWAMDLNPDQLLALKKIPRGGMMARTLEAGNRLVLQNATLVVALDRFMAERLRPRGRLRDKMVVIPPWPHETFVDPVPHDENPFRKKHGLEGKFVVMYSGNHSPSNPLDTVLEAAVRLKHDDRIRFAFVGGGIGKKAVEEFIAAHNLTNCLSLPYQPIEDLRYSLSAADVHVVSLGNEMVGIIHPCKVYGAMAVARPVLFVGPAPSHIADLVDKHGFGVHHAHGDVEGVVQSIQRLSREPREVLESMGREGQQVLRHSLSQQILCGRFCDGMELMLLKRLI
jgi:glycosyltransferase involved in cell wall biosynthesis